MQERDYYTLMVETTWANVTWGLSLDIMGWIFILVSSLNTTKMSGSLLQACQRVSIIATDTNIGFQISCFQFRPLFLAGQ